MPSPCPAISPGVQTLLKKMSEKVPAFQGLELEEIAQLLQFADKKTFQPTEPMVIEGKVGSFMYLLIDGEAKVSKRVSGSHSVELARLGPAECFGEMSVIDHEPRSATVTATTPCTVLRLNALALQARPEIGMKIFRNLARIVVERLRKLEAQMHRNG